MRRGFGCGKSCIFLRFASLIATVPPFFLHMMTLDCILHFCNCWLSHFSNLCVRFPGFCTFRSFIFAFGLAFGMLFFCDVSCSFRVSTLCLFFLFLLGRWGWGGVGGREKGGRGAGARKRGGGGGGGGARGSASPQYSSASPEYPSLTCTITHGQIRATYHFVSRDSPVCLGLRLSMFRFVFIASNFLARRLTQSKELPQNL